MATMSVRHDESATRDPQAASVLVSGASGLVGQALTPALTAAGHATRALRRGASSREAIGWDPDKGTIDAEKLEGFDAVVHLAGENIAEGRWTADKKRRIRDSRIGGTRLLCETLSRLKSPPKTLVCASAIGYYGHRGDALLSEDSGPGNGFLPEVCVAWEAATRPAADRGIRVVSLRIGIVLSPLGGALQKMLLPFKLGLGGVIGHGGQYWSWVSLPDLVGMIGHALTCDQLSGPVNAVSPEPVTNREFTGALGRVLHRPTVFPLPAFVARVVLGEMADSLLTASTRVAPLRLQSTGYRFQHPELGGALRELLQR